MQNDRGEVRIVSRDDLVRREIAAALLHKKIIFPVLLHDAKMPSADSLPEDIKALAEFNAERLVDEHWDATLEALLRALDSIVPCAANAAQPAESPNAWWFVKRALLIGVPKSTLGLVLRLIFYAATMATIVLVSAAIRFPDGRLTPQFLLLLAVAAGAAVVTWLLTATSEKHY